MRTVACRISGFPTDSRWASLPARGQFAPDDEEMQETPAELAALQELLDRSAATRNEHLLAIMTPQRRLSAGQIVTALTGMHVIVVATVTAAGEPRTSCLDGISTSTRTTSKSCATPLRARSGVFLPMTVSPT